MSGEPLYVIALDKWLPMRVHGMANISFTSWEWFVSQVVCFHIELEQVSPAFEVMEVDVSWILQERSFQVSSSWIHFRCA